MTTITKLGIGGLAILIGTVFLLRDAPWTCSIALETTLQGFSTSGTSMTVSEVDLGSAREFPRGSPFKTLVGGLPGAQAYTFSYSENVDRMGIWLDRELVYTGVPIPAFDARNRPRAKRIGVRVEGPGNTFFVRISDQCSLRKLASNLL